MKYLYIYTLLITCFIFGQQKLDSVLITSTRIDLPFKKDSRTITVITAQEIKNSAASTVVNLLQQVAGIDVRQRGTNGMQADLYIRGGSFDQTLLLIDGIKVEDSQTGHHTLNIALPIEVIERIEIIKGAAARVFGQNAFTGAINIVTKKATTTNAVILKSEAGSFYQKNVGITVTSSLEKSSHIVHYSRNLSDGYRYNTDFDNQNYFVKITFNKNKTPINLLATFSERKFGANGFYASPAYIDQYEETQASLIGLSTTYKTDKFTWKPKLYWKRNQDMYVFVRSNPSLYRNLHISNKMGAMVNASYKSNLGITGFGVDIAKIYLSSNNLGAKNRFMTTFFLEHRFVFLNDKLDITPGISLNYFSDFKFHAFPGIDLGYQLNDKIKVYANMGYTYRIPTYTDLFYTSPTTLGDENLEPEEAITEEIGVKYNSGKFNFSAVFFNKDASNLIDYAKNNITDKWQATNIQKLNTLGYEVNASYKYNMNDYSQRLSFGYTFLEDDLKTSNINFSRYSINSLKHHITTTYSSQFFKNIKQSITYKFAERNNQKSYNTIDAKLTYTLNSLEISAIANNIFNTEYTETSLVPMPKGNVLFGLKYNFK